MAGLEGEISHKDRGCYQESNQEVLIHMKNSVHITCIRFNGFSQAEHIYVTSTQIKN